MRDLVYSSLLVIGGTIVKGGAYVVISRLVVGVLVRGCVSGRRRDLLLVQMTGLTRGSADVCGWGNGCGAARSRYGGGSITVGIRRRGMADIWPSILCAEQVGAGGWGEGGGNSASTNNDWKVHYFSNDLKETLLQ